MAPSLVMASRSVGQKKLNKMTKCYFPRNIQFVFQFTFAAYYDLSEKIGWQNMYIDYQMSKQPFKLRRIIPIVVNK